MLSAITRHAQTFALQPLFAARRRSRPVAQPKLTGEQQRERYERTFQADVAHRTSPLFDRHSPAAESNALARLQVEKLPCLVRRRRTICGTNVEVPSNGFGQVNFTQGGSIGGCDLFSCLAALLIHQRPSRKKGKPLTLGRLIHLGGDSSRLAKTRIEQLLRGVEPSKSITLITYQADIADDGVNFNGRQVFSDLFNAVKARGFQHLKSHSYNYAPFQGSFSQETNPRTFTATPNLSRQVIEVRDSLGIIPVNLDIPM